MISPTGALLTDLYELTMLQSYHQHGMDDTAVFEFFVRSLPPGRGFMIAAGLQPVLAYLQDMHFTAEEIAWLRQSGHFDAGFLEHLAGFRFGGDVHAMPEGTLFFPDEPILRVTAPLQQAQLVETRVINLMQFQCMIASKAARCVHAAQGARMVDFGLRRAHGAEAGVLAARASHLAGFDASSAVVAGPLYDVPLAGTMAHSFIEAHDDEFTAFERFARSHPDNVILLIDTYDTEQAARKLRKVAQRLRQRDIAIKGVRLDSGDLVAHARKVRRILDDLGLEDVQILASGGIDEWKIHEIMQSGAPIDGFGVGTGLTTSADAPYLDCAYKLVEYAGRGRRKFSEKKATWPGTKQVFRQFDGDGLMQGDTIGLADEELEGEALLEHVMREGEPVGPRPSLDQGRERLRQQLRQLAPELVALDAEPTYDITISDEVKRLARDTDRWIRQQNEGSDPP